MTSRVNIYDQSNIDDLILTESETANLVKIYWVPMIKAGTSRLINNINTQPLVLTIDDLVLPITVNSRELKNSYVCSIYSHYITYTKAELSILENPLLEKSLEQLLNFMGVILVWGKINQVVIINNWLLSTNLYPNLSGEQIREITTYLQVYFPKHTFIFRSIHTFLGNDLFNHFQKNTYHLIGSRQIYLFNPRDTSKMRTKMRWRVKQDSALIQQQGYEIIDSSQIGVDDIPRIVELYNALYLEKYSDNNPQFNQEFVKLALKNKFLKIHALRKSGKIDGVIGFYELNGMMTTPLLGYDTKLCQSTGLYRMLSALLTVIATQKGIILHQSSGAASFKRFRGFIANIEYSAVFYQHLPLPRQLIWRLLGFLVNHIAVPLMKKYKL
jgi:hypothetical protein